MGIGTAVSNNPSSLVIFAHTADGIMGSIDLSWSLNKDLDTYVDIYGSNGTIHVGWQESKYRQNSSADWIIFGDGYNKLQAFRSQMDNFCKAIRKDEPLLISVEDAIASVRVIDACYQSLKHNHWVRVENAGAATPETGAAA